ncbi:hypothetical protein ACFYVR_26480 [Rhodococcus sp. NPDC003318]|uniref:hypothetical protein n=1 Tax=Rhodococcus sp. NPDC003318 TaxID=3364503 RepID=UPI00369F3CDC
MRIPLWIAGPAVIALSAVDATIEVQTRAVGALTRAAIRRMDTGIPARPSDSTGADRAISQLTWHSRGALMDYVEEVQVECGAHGPRIDAGDPPVCCLPRGHGGRHRPDTDDGRGQDLRWVGM